MSFKALVLYASITGNTEEIAFKFRDTFLKLGFECDCCKMGVHNFKTDPRPLNNYDIVCLGSPILAGVPHGAISRAFGWGVDTEITISWRPDRNGPINNSQKINGLDIKGIVFATYGGTVYGSDEALATLELEKLYLELNGISVVGKYCCPGREVRHKSVDMIHDKLKYSVADASQMLKDFEKNPNDPQFSKLSPEAREVMEQAAADKSDWGFDYMNTYKDGNGTQRPGSTFFHYDLMNRPSERDLNKAEYLITDLVEDYFFSADGRVRESKSSFISIT